MQIWIRIPIKPDPYYFSLDQKRYQYNSCRIRFQTNCPIESESVKNSSQNKYLDPYPEICSVKGPDPD